MGDGLTSSLPESSWQRAGRYFLSLEILPVLAFMVILFFFFGMKEPRFLSGTNLLSVLRNSSYLIIIAGGQMLVLVAGGFDLSVGAVVALTSTTSALSMLHLSRMSPEPVWLIVLLGAAAGLLVGSVVGTINGLCVASLGVSPFVVTLGTLSVCTGIAFSLTTGASIEGIPDLFLHLLGRMKWLGLHVSVYITALVVVAIWTIMNWTRIGRYIYAIGGNIQAARLSGVSTTVYLVAAYALCGFMASLTGLLLTARIGYGEAALGAPLMLESLAAAILGGVSLRGGVGRVEFVVIGSLFLSMVTNGMNLIRVDSKLQAIVMGIVLIAAVALDRLRRWDTQE
jgi:ribose/xylose/arabinose/galactoside ABC-type transport system permease subunit